MSKLSYISKKQKQKGIKSFSKVVCDYLRRPDQNKKISIGLVKVSEELISLMHKSIHIQLH